MRRWLIGLIAIALLVVCAFLLSPWPSVALIRFIFDDGAAKSAEKLEKHVPPSVKATTVRYDQTDSDAVLDVYRSPHTKAATVTVVWIHGGGFVSGRREDLTNYLKVLAGQGFNVVNIDYTIAPEAHYPTPIRQVNKALAYLQQNGQKLGVDPGRMVLAGDSAGAQIAAQTAAVISDSAYARLVGVQPGARRDQIAGVLLYCGVYDVTQMGKDGGLLGWFVSTTGWAYSGDRNWRETGALATMSLAPHLTSAFPPAFISAGNADPLGPQSVEMAKAIRAKGGKVEPLFFAADYTPPLNHEYQFDLDTKAGKLALEKSTRWLKSL